MRPWAVEDAPLLQQALVSSSEALSRWTPWVLEDHDDRSVIEERLRGYRNDFFAGEGALYALLSPDEEAVWGGAGLYPRVGPGALEIGYWVASGVVGRGLATEATAALTEVAFTHFGVDRVEIHCSAPNVASNRIPEKLGYRHRETREGEAWASGDEKADLIIWERSELGDA